MISGLGIDLVQIHRIKEIIEKWDQKFTERIFTSEEIKYCSNHKNPHLHYASTFAAKEALIKAHGRGNLKFKEIEIVRENTGKPIIKLSGNALTIIKNNNINNISVSLTHDGDYSIAVVVLEH
jgi:holo-[acyl-carrier protein] synthase